MSKDRTHLTFSSFVKSEGTNRMRTLANNGLGKSHNGRYNSIDHNRVE